MTGPPYAHFCDANGPSHGVEGGEAARVPGVPLVADLSSHILSRPWTCRADLIYAGAQRTSARRPRDRHRREDLLSRGAALPRQA